jgi:hypothetical protein
MKTMQNKVLAYFNGAIAIIALAGVVWFRHAGHVSAAQAAIEYGHNVDSGAIEGLVASVYFAPLVVLFLIASIAMWRGIRERWWAQGIALVWLIVPAALSAL